jgi:hypothetical protein
VLTYAKLVGYLPTVWPAGQVGQLPITITYTGVKTYMDVWSAFATVGALRLNFYNTQNLYNGLNPLDSFRYVIIPSGAPPSANRVGAHGVASPRYTREQLRSMPYEQVARLFHIPLD